MTTGERPNDQTSINAACAIGESLHIREASSRSTDRYRDRGRGVDQPCRTASTTRPDPSLEERLPVQMTLNARYALVGPAERPRAARGEGTSRLVNPCSSIVGRAQSSALPRIGGTIDVAPEASWYGARLQVLLRPLR
jgi:hypothetical protein